MKKEVIISLSIVFFLVLILFIAITMKIPLKYGKKIIEVNSEEGVVSLVFDDGYSNQYYIAYFLMKRFGYNGTAYIMANLTSSFEARELMSLENAKEMQDGGWEIGSHSLTHTSLIKLNPKELNDDLFLSKKILEDKGFRVKSVAFPYGVYNSEIIVKTKKYYSSSRPLFWGYNEFSKIDIYFLKSKWVASREDSQGVCSWIKYAKENKLWLILNFHYIGGEERTYDFSKQKFAEVLKCINETQIKVKTISEVLQNEKGN